MALVKDCSLGPKCVVKGCHWIHFSDSGAWINTQEKGSTMNHQRWYGSAHFVRVAVSAFVITLASVMGTSLIAGAHSNDVSPAASQTSSSRLVVAERNGSLTPTLTCVDISSKSEYTAYFGYTNTGSSVTYPTDSKFNRVSPSSYNGAQPTDFPPGTFSNVFSVLVTSPSVSWTLDRSTVSASSHSTQCSDSSLPVDPLGLSLVLVLGVGIVVGAIFVTRTARRRESV